MKGLECQCKDQFGSYLLESENSRDIGKQESNTVELDFKKIAWGSLNEQGKY